MYEAGFVEETSKMVCFQRKLRLVSEEYFEGFPVFPLVHTCMFSHTGSCIQFARFLEVPTTLNVHSQILNYACKVPLFSLLITTNGV